MRNPQEDLRRSWLAGVGAVALGLSIGVLLGLATRPRREQVSGPPVYQPPADRVYAGARTTEDEPGHGDTASPGRRRVRMPR